MAQDSGLLTPDRKMMALRALDPDACLRQRGDCDWYFSARVERVEGPCLVSGGGFSSITPQSAIERYWAWATEEAFHLRVKSANVRWNGFMWEAV